MDKHAHKSNESSMSTTGTTSASPHYSDTIDNNVKYMNLNFNDISETSSQPKDFSMDHRKGQNGLVQGNSTYPRPNKILPPFFPLGGVKENSNKTESESVPKEKSLLEMGFNANEAEGWKNVQPPKENLYKLLKDMVDKQIKPNVQIRIGDIIFNCHMMVLQCYSDLFMEFNTQVLIQLPEEKVTPGAFVMVYDWMLAEEPLVQREGILELFNAANFLRIRDLINQCWFCLGDDECFREDTAFLLYLEARKYGLEALEQLMLMRVCKFFLTLVASKEFLDLSAKEICTLLSSNMIGVNSEIEIFMSAVRWMSHDWEERERYLIDIMKCIRFTLMPSWFLVTLTKNAKCKEIDRVVSDPEVKTMINDGISYVASQMQYGENRDEFLQFLDRLQLVSPKQRQWIYDKQCSYHHRLACPNMEYVTYKTFLNYLEHIRNVGKEYWRSVEMVKDVGKPIQCCIRPDCRKSIDQPLAPISPQKSCDQGMQCEVDKSLGLKGKERNTSRKTNSLQHRSIKGLNRRGPWECTKLVPSLKNHSAKNMNLTETEAEIKIAVNLKNPQENDEEDTLPHQQQHEQLHNVVYDNKDRHTTDTKIQRKHIANFRPIVRYDSSIARGGDKRHHSGQQQQQQQQLPLTKPLQPIKQHTTATTKTNVSCNVIYKPDDKSRAEGAAPHVNVKAVVNGDNTTGQGTSILNNNDVLRRSNDDNDVGIVIEKPVDGKTLLEWKRQSTSAIEHKWVLNRKILVFGGIDPYCLPCQQHEQQHQQFLLQQRKHMFFLDTFTTMQNPTPTLPTSNAVTSTTTSSSLHTNARVNNKFENFGDQVLMYETVDAMEWRHLSHIPFGSRHHHAVAVCNGLIYLVGGTRTALGCAKKSVFEKTVWCFDPQTLKWTLDSNLPESRRDFAIVAIDKKICGHCRGTKDCLVHESGFYVIGGEGTHGGALSTVWFYSVRRRVWIKKPPLKMGRYGLAAAMVNNEIWIAGGISNGNDAAGVANGRGGGVATVAAASNSVHAFKSSTGHVITDTIEIYTLKCTHEILAHNAEEGFENANTAAEGSGGGGDDGDGNKGYRVFNIHGDAQIAGTAEICACNIGQWIKSKLHLRLPRVFGKFCKMTNGDLYLVGGIGPSGKGDLTSLSDIDHYQVKQQKWRHCGDLNWPRHGHDVGPLNDHCFAVIGGVSTVERSTLSQVEVFCTETRKCLNHLPDLPWPVSGSAVAATLK